MKATATHEKGLNVDVKIELGGVICPRCRRTPRLQELFLDRAPKSPSIIVPR